MTRSHDSHTDREDRSNQDGDPADQDSTTDPSFSSERPGRILFRVLFQQILQNRRAARQQTPTQPPALPSRPLRILSNAHAEALGVVCRFCFEGQSGTTGTSTTPQEEQQEANQLVAPCNCAGGSEWVHFQCIRQWQQHAASSPLRNTQQAATICNVCTSPYLLAPPRVRKQVFQRGTLLVYMDSGIPGSFFNKTVVLLLNDMDDGPMNGLIINSSLERRIDIPASFEINTLNRDSIHNISWRRGGPVCGGRLGPVRYVVAHTLDIEQGRDDDELSCFSVLEAPVADQGHGEVPTTRPHNPLCFLYETSNNLSPAMFRGSELPGIIEVLTSQCRRRSLPGRIFFFAGYAKWGRSQLEREVQRGSWGVCDGRLHDVLRPDIATCWQNLQNGNRLLPTLQLVEDDAVLPTTTTTNTTTE
jgi:putative AlgH/UPF0301 family transcriptional regulator